MAVLVELATTEIWSHEPCWHLSEINRPALDSKSVRRYQTITIIRNDRRVKLERDIGDARLFGEEFQLICGVPDGKGGGEALYSVDEAIRMAQDMNLTPPPKTEVKPKDWTKIFWENIEERNKWMKGQSVFGPNYKKERT